MTIKNLTKMAAVAALLTAGFASCSDDDNANTSRVPGTQEALQQACDDWRTARANWENSEAFRASRNRIVSIPTPTLGP